MTEEKRGFAIRVWRMGFDLTIEERRLIVGILAIVLVGLTARYLSLRGERPDTYQPEGLKKIEQKGVR